MRCKRIGFQQSSAVMSVDRIFIRIEFMNFGNETFPHTAVLNTVHGRHRFIPIVEIADYRHILGIGCPDTENSFSVVKVKSKIAETFKIRSLMKIINSRIVLVCHFSS